MRMKCRAVGPLRLDDSFCQFINFETLSELRLSFSPVDFEPGFFSNMIIASSYNVTIFTEKLSGANPRKMIAESCRVCASSPRPDEEPWILNETDVEYVCSGAAILGCGGGGNPYIGKLRVLNVIEGGKYPTVVSHKWYDITLTFCKALNQ